ncbi:MAG: hypothetical protein KF887_13190 [Paracoccaceae bacterium]|nr:MAG: hypothetical protein KF887_13190 [Paracoccaceae bacterium]
MTVQTINLHVGHGKTGSSFIQSSLALSQEALDASGVAYPIDPRHEAAGRAGHISSGNVKAGPGGMAEVVRWGEQTGHPAVLLSSEALFLTLSGELEGDVAALRAAFPDARLRVLIYIRDPLDHAASTYQQQIKRGGYTGSFADSLARYKFPMRVARFVPAMQAHGAEVTVRNYSRHSKALLTTFEDWLGLPYGSLVRPPVDTVNRSMTLAELELQRQFNTLFGREARRFVSDPLCNLLPEVRSETPSLSADDLGAFLERMAQMVSHDSVTAVVPADEAYRVPALDEVAARFAPIDTPFPFAFTADQLRIVVEAFHAEFQRRVEYAQRGIDPADDNNPRPREARKRKIRA